MRDHADARYSANAKVSDRGQPPLTVDWSLSDPAGSGSLDRLKRPATYYSLFFGCKNCGSLLPLDGTYPSQTLPVTVSSTKLWLPPWPPLFGLLTIWYRPTWLPGAVAAATAKATRTPVAKPITVLLVSIFVFINRDA
jgi:hypothetical protein